MLRFSKIAFVCAVLIIAATRVSGFSLLGPYATWMDTIKSYQQTPVDIGGPMNIGEDYRWNVPQITYGFDESFLQYFGSNGVYAVEQAIKILNDLPRASDIDLSKYPRNTVRTDYRASSLILMDIKSYVLAMLLEQLGLAPAERFVWCLREEWHDTAGNPNFIVIKRNFDPETYEPSSYVNGTLYTYRITHADTPTHVADTEKHTVDPTMPAFSTVASQMLSTGQYFTGLTRDDVGGLKYLYRFKNFHVESGPSNVINGFAMGGAWSVVDPPTTNVASFPGHGGWGIPDISNTNTSTGTGTTTGTGTGTTTGTNGTFVANALRPGVEKLNFARINYDSLLGVFVPVTNRFVDYYITNNVVKSQYVEVQVSVPDIIFAAADLGVDATTHFPLGTQRTDTTGWVNNDALNGASTLDGPGNIPPGITITLSKVGPWFSNGPGYLTEGTAQRHFVWGSFDGSTNAPIVYPQGMSIRQLERQILGY